MHSTKDFEDIEEELISRGETYTETHQHGEISRTLLVSIRNLKEIQGEMSLNHFQSVELRHQFQEIFYFKGANALQAAYWLNKHHLYDAAYREMRYLYETYLLLKGLNRDKEYAAEIVRERVQQGLILQDIGFTETYLFEFSSVGKLHDVWKAMRSELVEENDIYNWMYNYLSNRSTHPVRIEGAGVDGEHDELAENQLLRFGLLFCFGLAKEYWKTYAETPASPSIYKQVYPLCITICDALPERLRTFVAF